MELTEESKNIKNLIGKPYWENRHLLKYGGSVDTNGLIREAITKEEVTICPKYRRE